METSTNPSKASAVKAPAGQTPTNADTQVVGFRIDYRMARDIKKEAARRNLKLKDLLAEMWELYKKTQQP